MKPQTIALPLAAAIATLVAASCAPQATSVHPQTASRGESTMDGLFEVKNITVSIRRSPSDVYAFVSNGENIPRWATGLGKDIQQVDGEWLSRGPLGSVRVRFAPPNDLGVADHDVTLETGATVHNPVRVVPNGAGSTVIFTLLRLPGVSEQAFNEDARTVEKDLALLKGLLEQP